ncbi:hypothetical protein LPJ63_002788 [Coemansia sp. RSA 2711]|nr:hypothetical protein LPJ63_002788 [Coemansia sp. RSA 2711]
MALLTMMSFTYLQIEACNLVADIVFVLLVVYYSESIVVEYSGDQVFAAATALYRDVVLRVGLGLLCVGVVVSRF